MKVTKQNRRVPVWVMLRTNRNTTTHPKRHMWRKVSFRGEMMAEIKEMTIPLRAAWNVPRTRRANRAITEIKNHVARHMKKRKMKISG